MTQIDVIVIGGGPAGMFAAGFAALNGAKVLLLEKNMRCGAKVLITGKGRCNITNDEDDPRQFCTFFGKQGKGLLTALYAFGKDAVIDFFNSRQLELKVERGGRIFPANGNAGDVQGVLERFVQDAGVKVLTDHEVTEIKQEGHLLSAVTAVGQEYRAGQFIVATGGLSYPETGCTGDGYRWAEQFQHQVIEPQPALVPVRLKEKWTGNYCRFNMKNVAISVVQNGQQLDYRQGEAFFTHGGIGGPIILDMSATIRDGLKKGAVSLLLDMKPAVSDVLFDKRLQRELNDNSNKNFPHIFSRLLPKDMIPLFIELAEIDPHKKCHSVTKAERTCLLHLFKRLPLHVSGVGGFDRAIITSGGVDLSDIDMRNMRSKKIPNLYFAGEMIDLDAPTGGYNLQLCWSTGFLAGVSAAESALAL
jgi:predicted Rossmann fold flavoprotein